MLPLILMCSFLLIIVFGRIFTQYLKTGDFGVRAASLNAPIIEILPGTVFILTFCFAFILVIMGYFGSIKMTIYLSLYIETFGFLIGFIGISVAMVGQIQMGNSWRIGVNPEEQTELITTGLYAKSRNPIYFGILLFWIGLTISFLHLLLFASALVCWFCIELMVRRIEEPYLIKKHGNAFTDYVENTNRYYLL